MIEKANQFKQLHICGETFIMPNAWNPGSAVLLEQAGFNAIGTTSAGIAFSRAVADYEGALSFDTALKDTTDIANAVNIAVSMDGENGYADAPENIAENIMRMVDTGVVGTSIEDHSGDADNPLYDIELATDRIRAASHAVASLNYPITITARAECYLVGTEQPFAAAVERVNRYYEAGADCLYVPGIRDIQTIKQLVREVNGPLNVVMGLSGKPVTLAELSDAGVARVSIGGSLARATFGLVRRAAREMLEHGTFSYAAEQIPDSELCELFATKTTGKVTT
jgi:2-methylisocitrate lyase-like PEP mutase family enzyme